jgi:hypothetical protein
MKLRQLASFAVLFAGASGASLWGQEGPIDTDRPGLLFTTTTVGAGTWQIETGLPYLRDRTGAATARTESLLLVARYGLGPRWELRLGAAASRFDAGGGAVTGWNDIELGAKVTLRDGQGAGPSVALIPAVSLPTGKDAFSAGDALASLNGVAAFPWGDGRISKLLLGARGNLERGEFLDATAAALAGHGLPWAGWSSYAEAGWTEPDRASGAALIGAGVAYLVRDDLQLDASFQHGVTDSATDWRLELGVGARF